MAIEGEMLMGIEKKIKKINKILLNNKGTALVSVFVLLVRIKNSAAPFLNIFSNCFIVKRLFEKPLDDCALAEIINFVDALGMSFLASLVFLFTSVTLPNMKKNKIARSDIEDCVDTILKKIENITVECIGLYQKNSEAPKRSFSEYKDEDITWVINNVNFQKKIYLKGKKFITGFQFMYEQAIEIKKEVDYIKENYREYLMADELAVLKELENSCYLQRSIERYRDLIQSGQVDVPEETLEEIKKNSPKVMGAGAFTIVNCIVEESEIKNGVELYNKIKRTFVI